MSLRTLIQFELLVTSQKSSFNTITKETMLTKEIMKVMMNGTRKEVLIISNQLNWILITISDSNINVHLILDEDDIWNNE